MQLSSRTMSRVVVVVASFAATFSGGTAHPFAQAANAARVAVPRSDTWGIFDVGTDPRAEQAVEDLGVGWARVQLPLGDRGWRNRLDTIVSTGGRLVDGGVGIWLTLYHRDADNVVEEGTVGFDNTTRGGFAPKDPDAYQSLVRRAVRDVARMISDKGLEPGEWLVVQFSNEVAPADVFPPDKASRFFHGTADAFLAMVALGHDAVKQVDPDIAVSLPGISSGAMQQIQDGDRAVKRWNKRLLKEGKADWADVHVRHELRRAGGKVRWVDKRWDGLLAATEVAGPDPRTDTWSEQAQERELPKRMRKVHRKGVDRAFWAALVDNSNSEPEFRHEGLIDPNPWRRKPAFDAYRELVEAQ